MEIMKWTEESIANLSSYAKGLFFLAMHKDYPQYKETACKLTDIIEGPDFLHVWFWNDKNVPFYITLRKQILDSTDKKVYK